jgi:hypothetical protein
MSGHGCEPLLDFIHAGVRACLSFARSRPDEICFCDFRKFARGLAQKVDQPAKGDGVAPLNTVARGLSSFALQFRLPFPVRKRVPEIH